MRREYYVMVGGKKRAPGGGFAREVLADPAEMRGVHSVYCLGTAL